MGADLLCRQLDSMLILMSGIEVIIYIIFCLSLALCIGFLFGKYLQRIQDVLVKDIGSSDEALFPKDKWIKFVDIGELTQPTKWLGIYEIIFYFICLFVNKPEGIGVWLVFKVAAKWETWNNIVKVPDKIEDLGKKIDDLEYLKFRNKLSSIVMQKYLIGTLGNILAAFMGIGVLCVINYLYYCNK